MTVGAMINFGNFEMEFDKALPRHPLDWMFKCICRQARKPRVIVGPCVMDPGQFVLVRNL